jgi:hypothetical protein
MTPQPGPASFCPTCGRVRDAGSSFCANCGTRFDAPAASRAPTQPAYSPQPYPAPVQQSTNGLAIASLVLGILWLYLDRIDPSLDLRLCRKGADRQRERATDRRRRGNGRNRPWLDRRGDTGLGNRDRHRRGASILTVANPDRLTWPMMPPPRAAGRSSDGEGGTRPPAPRAARAAPDAIGDMASLPANPAENTDWS